MKLDYFRSLPKRGTLRTIAGTLMLALVLSSLVACAPASPPSSAPASAATTAPSSAGAPTPAPAPTQAQPQKVVTIGFATTTSSAGEDEMWQKIVKAFETENPSIKVNVQLIPGQAWEKLRIMVQSDTALDVMNISDDDTYTIASSNKFLALDDWLKRDINPSQVSATSWNTFITKGKSYFVSPVFRSTLVVYNKDLFKAAGVADPPKKWADAWDWNTFTGALRKLSKTTADGKPDVYGFGGSYSYSVLWSFSNGGTGPYNADQTKSRMAASDVVDMYQSYADLILKEKVISPSVEPKDTWPMFNSGKLAMAYVNGGERQNIAKEVNWDVMPLPKAKVTSPTENFGRPFGVSAKSKQPEEAWTFVKFLLGTTAGKLMVDYDFGNPVNKAASDYFTQLSGPPVNKALYFEALQADVDLQNKNPLGEEWVEQFVRRGTREVMAGQRKADELLKERAANMDEFIARTGWKKE